MFSPLSTWKKGSNTNDNTPLTKSQYSPTCNTHPPPHPHAQNFPSPPTQNTHPPPTHTNHHHYYTHMEQQSQVPYRVISHSCWSLSFTKVTQLAQDRSPQLACRGTSKISQQNTHRKLWCPERRRGGGNRLALKNSVLSANSVMTEHVSSAVTARGGRHHDRCGSKNGHQPIWSVCESFV